MFDGTVSVVIPAYNAASYIAAAIDSVLAQTRPVSEIIVIDDGSADSTQRIVSGYPQVKRFNQDRQGPSAARNVGIRRAQGEFVAFLDSDDLWHPQKIEKQLTALAAYPSAAFSFSTLASFYMRDNVEVALEPYMPKDLRVWLKEKTNADGSAFGNVYQLLLRTNCVHTSSVIVRRDVLSKVGMFDETVRHGEDHDLWLRLSRRRPAVFITDLISKYRIHSASLSGEWTGREELFYRSSINILTKHRRAFPSVDAAKALAIAYNGYALLHLKEQRWAEAERLAAKGLWTMPTPTGLRLWLEAAFPKTYSRAIGVLRGVRPS
jgi:glycosyltransferase involved in cell wall biosynthesis